MTQQTMLTGTAAEEFAPPAPSRTPQLLRRLQAVVVLAVLIAGAVGVWVISDLRDDLASAPNLAQQYARLGQVQHSLTAATRLAAESVIAGEAADGDRATASSDQLGVAAALLVEAARDRPQDAAALGALSTGVLALSRTLAPVPGSTRTEAVTRLADADARLDHLRDEITTLQAQLASEAADRPWSQSTPWAVLACIAAIGVVGWVSWLVARRSHRVLNPGLVGAGLAVMFLLVTTTSAQGTAADASATSLGTQFTHVASAAEAVAQLDTAQRIVTTAVLEQHWDSDTGAAYTKALTAAKAAASDGKLPSLAAFDTATEALVEQVSNDPKAAAKALLATGEASVATLADNFLDKVDATSDKAVAAAATGPDAARSTLVFQLVLVILLAVAGAALGVLGIDRRLREYR